MTPLGMVALLLRPRLCCCGCFLPVVCFASSSSFGSFGQQEEESDPSPRWSVVRNSWERKSLVAFGGRSNYTVFPWNDLDWDVAGGYFLDVIDGGFSFKSSMI